MRGDLPDLVCSEADCPGEVMNFMDECLAHYNIRLWREDGGRAPTKFKRAKGRRFRHWKVLERADDYLYWNEKYGRVVAHAKWRVRCDCGNEREVIEYALRFGRSTACGCKRDGLLDDLTGQVFTRWLVIKRAEPYISPQGLAFTQWWCRCVCGTERAVLAGSLKKGLSTSCGCRKRETAALNLGRYAQKRKV